MCFLTKTSNKLFFTETYFLNNFLLLDGLCFSYFMEDYSLYYGYRHFKMSVLKPFPNCFLR